MNEEYTGKCYRHQTSFKPSEQFDNNCPGCYWESQYKKVAEQSAQPDVSERELTIIKSFPMRDAYPVGHKPRRKRKS